MVVILTSVYCLHTMCVSRVIATPDSFTMEDCSRQGFWLASKECPKNWRFVGHYCEEGRAA